MRISIFVVIPFLFILSCKKAEPPQHPQWLKDAVFYQIFPERFNNGDKSNDPTLQSLAGSWPHDKHSNWQVSPWTSDWYKLQPWEEANGLGFAHNAQHRRYGGDIQGIIDKLDYLKQLGVNTLYLNPVFHAPSLHKYDAAYYHHVDAHFGPDPQSDLELFKTENHADPTSWKWSQADKLFLELIKKAHAKGMRIVLDGVFNHTGLNFWAFKDVKAKGQASAYKDWYHIKAWDNPATEADEFDYAGWVGVKELPELKEDENGLIEPVKEHIFAIVNRWMDPNGDGNPEDGIDGWRLDVAEMVHHSFWIAFRKHVKAINPDAYITGEIFWKDWNSYTFMDPKPWLKGDQFDGIMNYRWSVAMMEFFVDKKKPLSAGKFADRLYDLDQSYHPETRYQLLNLLDSHDTDRLSSHIVNPDIKFDKYVNLTDNPTYDIRKPNAEEWRILKLMALVQMTFPGPPMIYYGTEAGMWGADDPDERKPMLWPELQYEDEVANISQTPRPVDKVAFDSSLFNYYKSLIKIRNEEPALRGGAFKFAFSDNNLNQLIYLRSTERDKILVVINNAENAAKVKYPMAAGSWKNLMDGTIYKVKEKFITLPLERKSAMIIKKVN